MDDKTLLDKAVGKLFTFDKNFVYVVLIALFGFILRSLVALRTKFSADEMVHGTHAIGFISSGKLQIMDESAVWFWLTDFFMRIFGYNVFGIRFASIFFGTLAIIVIYLICKEVFNKEVGLIAAVISAISSYQLDMMEAGMDTTMVFFVLFALYFFVLSTRKENKFYFYLIWLSAGISVMAKPIGLLFIIPLGLCSIYYHFYKLKSIKIKDYLFVIILLLLIFTPVLTFNYLLYKDKGILDLQFSRFTRISVDTYASIAPTIESFSISTLLVSHGGGKPGIIVAFKFMYLFESIFVLVFALAGLFFIIKNKNKFLLVFIATFILPFIFLAGTSLLPNHFVFTSYYAVIFASYGIYSSSLLLKNKKHQKILIYALIILILITSYIKIANGDSNGFIGTKNELGQMIDFKETSMDKNAFVLADSRIYRGRIAFMFWDKHYMEGNVFLSALANMDQIPGQEIYFIECVQDDCGWGGGKVTDDFNKSMEDLVSVFGNQNNYIKTINDVYDKPYFKIYKKTIALKSGMIPAADSLKEWFFYPLNYQPKSKVFDNYQTHTLYDKLLDQAAHAILYITIIICGLLVLLTVYLLYKEG
ncbi:MAG: glycosyltransferase family 39 protein [Candidatus Woesearchaeota archaeon]|jgi:hypothetical protein